MPASSSFFSLRASYFESSFRALSLLAALIVLCATGCRNSANTVKVQGHVSYKGEALTNATVNFFPTSGRPVVASLTGEGNYTAELAPGDYVVVVMVGTTLPEGYKEGDPVPPPKIVLPVQYTTRVKSTLRATVTQEQTDAINFDLK